LSLLVRNINGSLTVYQGLSRFTKSNSTSNSPSIAIQSGQTQPFWQIPNCQLHAHTEIKPGKQRYSGSTGFNNVRVTTDMFLSHLH